MSFGLIAIILLINTSIVLSWYPVEVDVWVPGHHSYHGYHDGREQPRFADEWTVLVEGGEDVAQLVALEQGYLYGGPVIGFTDTYSFKRYPHSKQRRDPTEHAHILTKDRRVRWAEPLYEKLRVKRYPTPDPDDTIQRVKRIDVEKTDGRTGDRRKRDISKPLFNDELWSHEWYLQDTRTEDELPRLDLNVLPVYAMGFTGKGIRVSVLDDGIEHNHTDLRANYDSEISWDSNNHDPDPLPRYEEPMRNSHGTRCAGEIAMIANNVKCGVGVAWGAKVGGVRMLDGRITDRIEGEAIGYAHNKVDIYSASWGPNDDGRTVEGPGRLAIKAFERGIEEGREGKGNIYVWANGNGGGNYDNCNCDGYSASIYTISIGSASQHGLFPWYGEICSSTLATAYSSGAYKDQKIATTDTGNSCTLSHTGTSAAAPLAAGIIALALEANYNLTWRDVQHLIVWTSEYAPLSANAGWKNNGAGFWFDVRFGFGLLNAGALVLSALNWTTVPDKLICRIGSTPSLSKDETLIRSRHPVEIVFGVEDCMVNYLEHVELIINLRYSRRGAMEVFLQSPQGTNIQVLSARPKDTSTAGFVNWPLTSVATWGENPNGVWTVIIQDMTEEDNIGQIGPLSLILHGTNEIPNHMKDGPRKYNEDYNLKQIIDYIDNVGLGLFAEDNDVAELPANNNTKETIFNAVDTTLFDTVENELQRIHHRMNLV